MSTAATSSYAVLEVSDATFDDVYERLITKREPLIRPQYVREYTQMSDAHGLVIVLGAICLAREKKKT